MTDKPTSLFGDAPGSSDEIIDDDEHQVGDDLDPVVLAPTKTALEPGQFEVVCTIKRIIFHNPSNNFKIVAASAKGKSNFSIKVTTSLDLKPGDLVRATGTWGEYNKEPQFTAVKLLPELPKEVNGLRTWLQRSGIKGVGVKTAERLANAFGDDLQNALSDVDRMIAAGINENLARVIAQEWEGNQEHARLIGELMGYGLSDTLAHKAIAQYEDQIRDIVATDPWRMAREITGLGFKTADDVGRIVGLAPTAPERIRAGLFHSINELTNSAGHNCVAPGYLVSQVTKLLNLSRSQIEEHLSEFYNDHSIVYDKELNLIYLRHIHRYEKGLADALLERLENVHEISMEEWDIAADAVDEATAELGKEPDEDQRKAAIMALVHPICVITGGPGTGKSTIQKIILTAAKNLQKMVAGEEEQIALAAPTGRAARRLAEVTGDQSASTAHRLLGFNPMTNGFIHNKANPLDYNRVVVDEFSMMDSEMSFSIVTALKDGASLLIVGDGDQLPSVGPGRVMSDLIESGTIPVARLKRPRRQNNDSGIITAAYRINSGEFPIDGDEILNGFSVTPLSNIEEIADEILRVVEHEVPAKGFDPRNDVQILTAMKKGPCGSIELNQRLKALLNPADNENTVTLGQGRVFTIGDRIMQIRNDYEKTVFNGEIGLVNYAGLVLKDNRDADSDRVYGIHCAFPEIEARYVSGDVSDLDYAWCATVHKSQGCEFPFVIMGVPRDHQFMLDRRILYTGVTRAAQECMLIGDKDTILRAIARADRISRITGLRARLGGDAPTPEYKPEAPRLAPAPAGGLF